MVFSVTGLPNCIFINDLPSGIFLLMACQMVFSVTGLTNGIFH